MGFDVKIKGSSRKDMPTYSQTYTITTELSKKCPILNKRLFYDTNPHVVCRGELKQALHELEIFLDGYVPKISGRELDSAMIITHSGDLVTVQDGLIQPGLNPQEDIFLKNAAVSLKEVIQFARQNKKDIEVS